MKKSGLTFSKPVATATPSWKSGSHMHEWDLLRKCMKGLLNKTSLLYNTSTEPQDFIFLKALFSNKTEDRKYKT